MFDRWKNRKRNKEMGIEKEPKASYISPLMLLTGASVIPALFFIGFPAFGSNLALTLGTIAGVTGATFRFIRDVDNYAVGQKISDKTGLITKPIYNLFSKTPLRFYTINQITKRLEDLQKNRSWKQVKKNKKEQKKNLSAAQTEAITQSLRDTRTTNYIKTVADSRRHMRYIAVVALGVFTGVRILTGNPPGRSLSPLQVFTRVAGYGYTMGFAASHAHTYVKKRAAESNPRPFFIMINKVLDKSPTNPVANWLLKLDLNKINDLEQGRQVWHWRVWKTIADKMPGILRNWLNERLDKSTMKITPAVQATLERDGFVQRVDELKAMGIKKNGHVKVDMSVSNAYNELMGQMDQQLEETAERFMKYEAGIKEKNREKIELFNLFNSTDRLPIPDPIDDPEKEIVLTREELKLYPSFDNKDRNYAFIAV